MSFDQFSGIGARCAAGGHVRPPVHPRPGEPLRAAVLSLLAGLAVAPDAAAQDRGGTVPEEFVRAMFAGFGDQTEVVVGRLPEGIPRAELPAGARVIGGLRHPRGATAVIAMPVSPDDALAAYGAQLELASGWRRVGQQEQPPSRSAFVSTTVVERTLVLCGPGGVLRPVAIPRREGGSYLRLTFDQGGGAGSPCSRGTPAREAVEDDVPFPSMQPLPGSMTRGHASGSSSSSGEGVTERSWAAYIEASAGTADIAAHYAAEMRRAGWTVDAPAATPGVAAVTAETRDAQGRAWRGVLTVVAKPGSQREAQLRVMRWAPR